MALTANKITKNIKTPIDDSINNLIKSITEVGTQANNLYTFLNDEHKVPLNISDNLYYRFNDLHTLTQSSAKKLGNFLKKFDSSLDEYIKATKNATKQSAEEDRKAIDQFAEAATRIDAIKM